MFHRCVIVAVVLCSCARAVAGAPAVYLWHEPEWFEGVEGRFGYWGGNAKPTGHWSIAGPGISAEWSQGGESEWNSMGVPAEETKASCGRDIVVPRAGKYRVWVRYYDHRRKTEPFTVAITQSGKSAIIGEFGVKPVLPENDEHMLYWGFAFGWGSIDGNLAKGPARLTLSIDKAGEAFRQIDAVLITDDLSYQPVGREKPPFAYLASFTMEPQSPAWRGNAKELAIGDTWRRGKLGGRDFSMWTGGLDPDPKWWAKQNAETVTLYDIIFQHGAPADIREEFQKQFAGRKDVPIMSWPGLLPVAYLGASPDLTPGTPLRQWLERTKTPFAVLTNYAIGRYDEKNGPATYEALTGPLAEQFLGYIHGEAIGTQGVTWPDKVLGATRREHADALLKHWRENQAEAWSKTYKTKASPDHFDKGISCLSVDSIALAHLFHEGGAKTVGYEEDATNIHVPMRIAFERGAARQYGQTWLNYASANFGDSCNYFTQNPITPRGAQGWFHSKYSVTDGVTVGWYRKLYYLNYIGGASAIFWEQGLGNQYFKPGPGTHPIQLSPFGVVTQEFQAFVDRLPERGEPYTPVGVLLNYGHSYERVNYACKMLNVFPENRADRELRELFNVLWYPAGIVESQPATPDTSMPSGRYGNIFDVLVDRPARARAILDYPVVIAAGDVEWPEPWPAVLREYVQKGGTLVVNADVATKLPAELLGVKLAGKTIEADTWQPDGGEAVATTPYDVATVELTSAKAIAWASPRTPLITRNAVGNGAVIVTLCPGMIGQDERAHPALPYLFNGLTDGLLPVDVRLANGDRPRGEIMHHLNRTKDGWLVTLVSNRGVDKIPNGLSRVDRTAGVDVQIRMKGVAKSVKEWTQPRDLAAIVELGSTTIPIRVEPGDVQVISLTTR